jgi:uncharacterized protein with GYD domain
MEAAGIQFKGYFLTLGRYDEVIIAETPNDETMTALALAVGSQGNVRTETMRAFTEDEYRQIIASLP